MILGRMEQPGGRDDHRAPHRHRGGAAAWHPHEGPDRMLRDLIAARASCSRCCSAARARTTPTSRRTSSSSTPGSRSQIGPLDMSINKAVLYLFLASALTIAAMALHRATACSSGRTASRPRSRPLYQLMKGNIAEGNMDRQHGGQVVHLRRHAVPVHLVLEHDRLPAAAHQHRAQGRHLRARGAVLRPLRGDRQHLGPAGADARGVVPLPRRGRPGEGLHRLPEELGAGRRRGLRGGARSS